MAKPVPAASDIWFGSVEDLLSALDKGPTTAASGAYTINLQTSAVPSSLILRGALKFEGLHVYQLQQRSDSGASQFLLRLGIIESDLEADAILAAVRLHYPGATKRFAGDADRTTITRLVSVATRRKAAAASHSSGKSPSEKPAQGPEAALISKVSVTENLQWNIDAVLSHLGSTHQAPPAANAVAAQVARRAAPAVPPVERPALRPAQPAARVAPTVRAINAAPAPPATHAAPPRGPAARTVASGAAPPVAQAPLPAIDSTQTVRALTAVELDDGEISRWFVLQLVQSHEQIDPEQVPSLDIFCEYRLYTVGEASAQGLGYALRLGFFSSEVAAKAVASYLAPHFPATNIKRISVAEHDRFAQNLVVAKKDVGETGRYAVIEFTSRPELPPMAVDSAAPLEADKPPPQAAASLWSRLVQRRVSR